MKIGKYSKKVRNNFDEALDSLTKLELVFSKSKFVAALSDSERTLLLTKLHDVSRNISSKDENPVHSSLNRERFLDTVLSSLPSLVSYMDRDLNYLYVNTAYGRWFGVTEEQCLNSNMAEILGQKAVDAVKDRLDAALNGEEQSFDREVPYRHGGSKHILVKYLPDRDHTGLVQGIIAIVQDISDIVSRENHHRTLLQTMHEGLISYDQNGKINYINSAAVEILGLTEGQLKDQKERDPRWRLIHLDGSAVQDQEYPSAVVLRTGKSVEHLTIGVKLPSSEIRWLRTNAALVQKSSIMNGVPNREMQGVIVTFSDVTRFVAKEKEAVQLRLELEQALSASEKNAQKFRELFENLPVGIVKLDDNYRYTAFNPAFQNMIGYTESELKNLSMPDLTHPDDQHQSKEAAKQGLVTINGPMRHEKRYIHKDGHVVLVRITSHRFESRSDGSNEILGILEDVTEAKRIELELIAARDAAVAASVARTQFLANMSHEIRTPLNGIMGNMEVLTSEQLSKEQQECVDDARSSAHMLLEVLNDILDFSKIDAGHLHLELDVIELRPVICSIEKTYGRLFKKKNITLDISILPIVPQWVKGDSLRIRQILNNLISNSLKFTTKGTVTVHVSMTQSSQTQIEVSDSGIGMSQATIAKLFAPFEQGEAGTTKRFGGTGLGLSISRQLARLMDGDIKASSEEGKGAKFTVHLNLEPAAPPLKSSEPEPTTENARISPLRILVAEDNKINQGLIKRMLKKDGHHVEIAENGADALSLLATGSFDVILMDLQMPVMDGFETTKRIIEVYDLNRPKIVALTANAFKEDRQRCLALGMDDYLSKPVSKAQLEDVLRKIAAGKPSAA